jgi:glycogen operon protein
MVVFKLPECPGGCEWVRLVDTNLDDDAEQSGFACGTTYDVTGRSLLAFMLKPEASDAQAPDSIPPAI